MIVEKLLETIDLSFNRADEYVSQISALPLTVDLFKDIEHVKTIDGVIYRFAKIQDMMGEKLFSLYLKSVEEYKQSMSLIDMINKLEKLTILDAAEDWKYFRKLRNIVTHEYPDAEDELLQGIQQAVTVYAKVKAIYQKIRAHLLNVVAQNEIHPPN